MLTNSAPPFLSLFLSLSLSVSLPPSHTPAIGDYGAAIENYLQSGAISSDFFESDIPSQTWTPAVYHRMINCCGKLGYHTHAAILCQFLQPVDYELAFGILKNNVESTVDSLFIHFWDMTIIEYLICILAMQESFEGENFCNFGGFVATICQKVFSAKYYFSQIHKSFLSLPQLKMTP